MDKQTKAPLTFLDVCRHIKKRIEHWEEQVNPQTTRGDLLGELKDIIRYMGYKPEKL